MGHTSAYIYNICRPNNEQTRQHARRVVDRGDLLQPTYPQIGRSVLLKPHQGTTRTGTGIVSAPRKDGRGPTKKREGWQWCQCGFQNGDLKGIAGGEWLGDTSVSLDGSRIFFGVRSGLVGCRGQHSEIGNGESS